MAMNRSTRSYLDDITTNLSRDIREAIHNKMSSLIMVADSIMRMDVHGNEASVRDFLARKAEILEFDPLILLDRKGGYICSEAVSRDMDPKSFFGISSVQSSFQGEVRAGYMGGERDVYKRQALLLSIYLGVFENCFPSAVRSTLWEIWSR